MRDGSCIGSRWHPANDFLRKGVYGNDLQVSYGLLQTVKNVEDVLHDLDTMFTVLTKAKERNLKWYLQVDF